MTCFVQNVTKGCCRFMGVDSESKGYRVYWPGRNHVGIERDIYFNENEVLAPEEIQIEGGNDIFTNLNHPQPYPNSQTNPIPPQPVVIASNRSNKNNPDEAPIETPLNQLKTGNPENPTSAPHERHARRNSRASPSTTTNNSALVNTIVQQHKLTLTPMLGSLMPRKQLMSEKSLMSRNLKRRPKREGGF